MSESLLRSILERNEQYCRAQSDIKASLLHNDARMTQEAIFKTLEASGVGSCIRNVAFAFREKLAFTKHLDGDDGIANEQTKVLPVAEIRKPFADMVHARLLQLQAEIGLPLCEPRHSKEAAGSQSEGPAPWERVASPDGEVMGPLLALLQQRGHLEPLYSHDDLLHLITLQDGANGSASGVQGRCLLDRLDSPQLPMLKEYFAEMGLEQRQVGLDDQLHSWFADEQLAAARQRTAAASTAACRAFCRCGVPDGARPRVWEAALGLDPFGPEDQGLFDGLCGDVESRMLLSDALVVSDLESACSSEHFFLFEEQLRAVMLAFTRDGAVPHSCSIAQFPRMVAKSPGKGCALFPPNGVLPYRGMVLCAAPLCYLYENPAAIYRVLRSMYCRFWCRLHSAAHDTSNLAAFPGLCRAFDQLLQALDPEVHAHLGGLGCPPLHAALPWMASAFVGFLPVKEVLLLWDRIIGFDTLLPIALLAVAAMRFRRDMLLLCESAEEVEEVVDDLSELRVVPLLQSLLFGNSR